MVRPNFLMVRPLPNGQNPSAISPGQISSRQRRRGAARGTLFRERSATGLELLDTPSDITLATLVPLVPAATTASSFLPPAVDRSL
ncbi:hypothetical protein J6590_054367 [Homalodisca vitripennis]|nr:hypothetical protein J6590_054367 [Homalodisca vitripennis]